MKNDLLKKILDKNFHCVFVSPHEDDAILSCGALLSKLSGKVDVTVVNVFTKAHKKPYTLAARKFLKEMGYSDAEEFYEARRKEDKEAFSSLFVKIIYLDLEDALFRRKETKSFLGKLIPEFDHYYPTYRLHIVKNIVQSDPAQEALEKYLERFKDKKYLIFAPFGVGNHADHRIARLATEKVFDRYILYSDFPYNTRLHSVGTAFKNGQEFRVDPNMDVKDQLIKAYKTQFSGLFPNGIISTHQEVYFSNQKL